MTIWQRAFAPDSNAWTRSTTHSRYGRVPELAVNRYSSRSGDPWDARAWSLHWDADMEKNKGYLAKAHELGIRVIPYVSPEKAWSLDTPERIERFFRANPAASLPYYLAVDPTGHPEWILIDRHGRLVWQTAYRLLVTVNVNKYPGREP